jgi:1-acyl-sn-glycerol-3-phosphate acyltransferase
VSDRRPGARSGTPILIRLAAAIARIVLSLAARVRVEGLHDLPRHGPLIVVGNHLSNADPPLVVGWLTPALGRPMHILAKEALFVGPVGALLRSQGVTPVRSGGSDMEAFRVARGVLERGEVLCIFPEGTRSRTGQMQDPKPGVAMLATRTGAPILPVGISGADRFIAPGQRLPRLRAPITLRVGRPFTVAVDASLTRRQALARASDEIMGRIAALVEPRHRGRFEPQADEAPEAGGAILDAPWEPSNR